MSDSSSPFQQLELDLFATAPPRSAWPDPRRFPHNEAGHRVEDAIRDDLQAQEILLVVGYASLDQILGFLGRRAKSSAGCVRILFGNEPIAPGRQARPPGRGALAAEIRDYWLERGISILLSGDILAVREMVSAGMVVVRTSPPERSIHAKIYLAPEAVTLGSSNFTPAGMARQSEANARFERADPRYDEARALAEGLWDRGTDYQRGFLELLDSLLCSVTWQEALARACAEVLEGNWARKYVPPLELAALEKPLWPHQIQGISQAMWTLHNVGSVLIADAAGSGKTRLGSWLLRAASDRQIRLGQGKSLHPVVIAPPPVVESWERDIQETGLGWRVWSHGLLSHEQARAHADLVRALREAELLAIDEAHNFVNPSGRTLRVQTHYADNVILFTATPINRGAADLLGLVELLGPDHFDDRTLEVLKRLQRYHRSGRRGPEEDREALRREIRKFLVRRTRSELNACADADPEAYRLPTGRSARYPAYQACYYDLPASARDLELARRITALADRLKGVGRLGPRLELPRFLAFEGVTEQDYLRRLIAASAALARHHVLDCLRSSRAALYEHVHGTAEAVATLAREVGQPEKAGTGNMLARLRAIAGRPPEWAFDTLEKEAAPSWVWDAEAHAAACLEDCRIYEEIARLGLELSGLREERKADLLAELARQKGQVIGFDSHVLTLAVLEDRLRNSGVPVETFTGAKGQRAKRRALDMLGLSAPREPFVALCSEALSEGLNLQAASVVVHLDTPTVIRSAEQRAGRVDRMDSPHDRIEIWWPKDPPGFAPTRRDLLKERHELVSDLIGANLQMPRDSHDQEILDIGEVAERSAPDRAGIDPQSLFDAFGPIRNLVGDQEGLVPTRVYELMKTTQASVLCCLSLVQSETAWAFFAVGGLERVAPRWVFLDRFDAQPLADLAEVAAALRSRLGSPVTDHPRDARASEILGRFVERLAEREIELLPVRRRRALEVARKILEIWRKRALATGDFERADLLESLKTMTEPARDAGMTPDLRSVADLWLELLRQPHLKALEANRRRRPLRLSKELIHELTEHPIDTATLRERFAKVPRISPVSERIVAAIVGVPVSGSSGTAGVPNLEVS